MSPSSIVTCSSHWRNVFHLSSVGNRYSSTSNVAIHVVPGPYRARHELSAAY